MKLLVVGGGGFVGRVVQPTLEAEHTCTHYDLRPVEGASGAMIVADVNDDARVAQAVAGAEGILYMPMGIVGGDRRTNEKPDPAFDVNVKGLYRFLDYGLAAGVRWFCYVSTFSVYRHLYRERTSPLTEDDPPDATDPYGMSKRTGEFLCRAYAQAYQSATILVIRLNGPADDEGWRRWQEHPAHARGDSRHAPLGPESHRRLLAAALRCTEPGCHVLHASGDTTGRYYASDAARRLLHWEPIEA